MNKVNVKGILRLRIYRSGVLVEDVTLDNLVTNLGLGQYSKLAAGDPAAVTIARVGIGEENTPPQLTDFELDNPFFKDLSGYVYPANGQVKFSFTIGQLEANGMDVQEFGLFDSADTVLFARRTKPIGIKTADMEIVGDWTIWFK
jgi:hypothetical protein